MTALLGIITSRFAGPAALVGCAVLAFMLVSAKIDAGRWKSAYQTEKRAYDTTRDKLVTCQGNAARLEASVQAQNRAVEAAKADADKWERQAQEATQRASQATVKAKRDFASWMRRTPRGSTACARAEDVGAAIRGEVG